MEESASRCDSRKCPSEARPANLRAYRVVPGLVADFVMTLLRRLLPDLAFQVFPLHSSSERGAESRPEESYDRASLFRGRKSHLHGDCCNTNAPPSTSAPRYHRRRKPAAAQGNRGGFARPTAAGWLFPQSAEKTARPSGRRGAGRRQSFVLQQCAAELPHRDLECAV